MSMASLPSAARANPSVPTERQLKYLNDMGILPSELEGLDYDAARERIGAEEADFKLFKELHGEKPATGRQRAKAAEYDITIPAEMTCKEATAFLEERLRSAGSYTRDDPPTEAQLKKLKQLLGDALTDENTPKTKKEASSMISDTIASKKAGSSSDALATEKQVDLILKLDPKMGMPEHKAAMERLTKAQAIHLIKMLLAKKGAASANKRPYTPPDNGAGGAGGLAM